jgi:hypothetical protein
MSQNLQFLRSTTPGQKPTQLLDGQIAFNLVDKLLFVGDGSSVITDVNGNTTPGIAGQGFFESDLDITTAVAAAQSYTDLKISELIDGAPAVLDTLNELAAALGDDQNFVTTITNSITQTNADLATETARAQAAEASLASDLAAETARATAAETANANAISAETARATAAEAGITSNLNAEIARATAAEGVLTSDLAAEVARAQAAEAALASDLSDEVARATAAEGVLTSDLAAEVARAQAAEGVLTSDLAAEVARAQAAEAAEEARALAAEAALQAAIDAEAARAQAAESAEESRALAAEAALQSAVDAEAAARAAADSTLQSNVDAEAARAAAAESALDVRVTEIEEDLSTIEVEVFENNASLIGSFEAPVQDPAYREGWYFKNAGTGVNDRVNWVFYDGSAENVSFSAFTGYAVVTLDSATEIPYLNVYTKPTGTNDAQAGDHHSRLRYVIPAGSVAAGGKYVVYYGTEPNIHTELPKIQLVFDAGNSAASFHNAADYVKSIEIRSQSEPSAPGTVEFLLDAVGVKYNSTRVEYKTRLRKATVADLNFDFGTF